MLLNHIVANTESHVESFSIMLSEILDYQSKECMYKFLWPSVQINPYVKISFLPINMINYIIKREGNDWSRKKGVYEIQQVEGGDTQEGQQTRRMETWKKRESGKSVKETKF